MTVRDIAAELALAKRERERQLYRQILASVDHLEILPPSRAVAETRKGAKT